LKVESVYCARHEATYLIEIAGREALLAIQPDLKLMLQPALGQ